MNKVALLIGGNPGARQSLIEQATGLIQERIGTVVAVYRVYETEPWGDFEIENSKLKIENFLNRALMVETPLDAHAVLREALEIEKDLGRARPNLSILNSQFSIKKYHSRPMDIDLIFYNDEVIDTPDLQIPHPRMHLRRFVLEPLAEIIPDYRHPLLQHTIRELLDELQNEPPQGAEGLQAGVITPAHRSTQIMEPRLRGDRNT